MDNEQMSKFPPNDKGVVYVIWLRLYIPYFKYALFKRNEVWYLTMLPDISYVSANTWS